MINKIEEALEDFRQGKMLIVADDENRENEGDLILAADFVTPEAINFMITNGRGLVCVPMTGEALQRLGIGQMVQQNSDNHQTAFTVSVDHITSTTGISAYERSATIKALIDPQSTEKDFRRPGHIFPLQARAGGVLERAGHTETTVDLARLAGLQPAGILCEIVRDDGKMARLPDLEKFAQKWNLKLITVKDLIAYRLQHESWATRETGLIDLPTKWGKFKLVAYTSADAKEPHIALIKGDPAKADHPVLCRIHSECFTGDFLRSLRCDCGDQFSDAMTQIEKNGEGVLLYLRQEGRGIGLLNKLKAYELQDNGLDTVEANEALGFPAEMREFKVAVDILHDLGIDSVELLTNNPLKIKQLEEGGIQVQRTPLEFAPTCCNGHYLQTKKEKMGHLLQKVSG